MRSILAAAVFWTALVSMSGAAPLLPAGVTNTQKAGDIPLPPAEAVKRMTLPEGFKSTLFAGEPDVMQPVAFDFDDRGRLWVIECFSYPDYRTDGHDRILIFTDKDGDGRFDERKVFLEDGHHLSGLALGFGGVWVTSAPNLLFYPDANGDDVPDAKPTVLLDGWTLQAGHNMVNGLSWGPDGWLYGRHGITAHSMVGKPGTPESERVKLSCSIWRYHPVKQTFEVVAHGTTNPWGLDWDDFGQPFFSNNVIGHLWHLIPGAHYKRMFGEDFNPFVFKLMEQCADHLHWAGRDWTKTRSGQNDLGGGHSHSGAMIYLADNWPPAFRNRIVMGNLHGNRLLYDELSRHGSGYTARHGGNLLVANDPWFRAIQMSYGPDGGVFVTDWNDLGECHDSDGSYRSSGRIYKLTYGAGTQPTGELNLAKLTDAELVKLQLHTNDWYVRHARRLLQERAAAGLIAPGVRATLTGMVRAEPEVTRKLRALWALYVIGGLEASVGNSDPRQIKRPQDLRTRPVLPTAAPLLLELLDNPEDNLRWWAVQLLVEDKNVQPSTWQRLASLARAETSPFVRLSLASALQRLPLNARLPVAGGLAAHGEDASDQNIPLMIWYGIEAAVPGNRTAALQLAGQSSIPLIREFIVRRLTATPP